MEHLENIKAFISSSTFPLLDKNLQELLLKVQHEFLLHEIEKRIHSILSNNMSVFNENLTFKIILKKSEVKSTKDNTIDQLNSLPIVKFKNNNHTYRSINPKNKQYITNILPINKNLTTQGFVVIEPRFYNIIEKIIKKSIIDIDDEPIDIVFNDEIYEDAFLYAIDMSPDQPDLNNYYVQLRWSSKSYLGIDLKKQLSQDDEHKKSNMNAKFSEIKCQKSNYKYYSISWNQLDKRLHINLYEEKPDFLI